MAFSLVSGNKTHLSCQKVSFYRTGSPAEQDTRTDMSRMREPSRREIPATDALAATLSIAKQSHSTGLCTPKLPGKVQPSRKIVSHPRLDDAKRQSDVSCMAFYSVFIYPSPQTTAIFCSFTVGAAIWTRETGEEVASDRPKKKPTPRQPASLYIALQTRATFRGR